MSLQDDCKEAGMNSTMFRAQRYGRKQLIRAKWRKKCEVCRKRFPSEFWVSRHMKIHKKEISSTGRQYQCTICNKRFKEIANYIRHCAFHAGPKSKRKVENELVANQFSYEAYHAEDHVDEQSIPIVIMKESYASDTNEIDSPSQFLTPQGELNGYDMNERREGGRQDCYVCKFCGRTYSMKVYFDLHVKKHEGFERFNCELCTKSYSEVHKLNQHKRERHNLGFVCYYCGERFPTKEMMIEHRDAERRALRTCSVCSKVFTTVKSLHIHKRIHSGERPYKCPLCDAAFTQRYHLYDHERTHSGATPFACNYCDMSFTTQSSRRRHEKNIHKVGLTTQMHSCDICEATFARKDLLNRHLKRHAKISSEWLKSQKNSELATKSAIDQSKAVGSEGVNEEGYVAGHCAIANSAKGDCEENAYGSKDENHSVSMAQDGSNGKSDDVREKRNDVTGMAEQKASLVIDDVSPTVKERPVCELCFKIFSSQASLKKHMKRVHNYAGSGAICEVCNAGYMNRKTLQRHMLTAHNIKTVQEAFASIMCEECGALVQTKNGLELHKVKCH